MKAAILLLAVTALAQQPSTTPFAGTWTPFGSTTASRPAANVPETILAIVRALSGPVTITQDAVSFSADTGVVKLVCAPGGVLLRADTPASGRGLLPQSGLRALLTVNANAASGRGRAATETKTESWGWATWTSARGPAIVAGKPAPPPTLTARVAMSSVGGSAGTIVRLVYFLDGTQLVFEPAIELIGRAPVVLPLVRYERVSRLP